MPNAGICAFNLSRESHGRSSLVREPAAWYRILTPRSRLVPLGLDAWETCHHNGRKVSDRSFSAAREFASLDATGHHLAVWSGRPCRVRITTTATPQGILTSA